MNAETPNNNTLPVPPSPKGGVVDTPAERYAAFLDYVFSPETHQRRYGMAVALLILGVGITSGAVYLADKGYLTAWAAAVAGVLIAGRGLTLMHAMVRRAQLYGRRKQVARKAELVTAYVVHCPTELLRPLRRPRQEQSLPCRVVFSFQSEVGDDTRYMRYIATQVAELKDKLPRGDMDKQYIAALASEPQTRNSRRYLLPLSFTDGSAIYLADVLISRAHLPGGYLHTDAIPCLAEPGPNGGIEMMPEWLLDPKKPRATHSDPLPPVTDDAPLGLG